MKALTIWQPWATLIMAGAKRYEFRGWPAPDWMVGKRMVIHAAARWPKPEDIRDIFERMDDGVSALDNEIARPILEKLQASMEAHAEWKAQQRRRPRGSRLSQHMRSSPGDPVPGKQPWDEPEPMLSLPLACGLGTVILEKPRNAASTFKGPMNDSYRVDHSMWAWPLKDIERWDVPVPARGAQGFWEWREAA